MVKISKDDVYNNYKIKKKESVAIISCTFQYENKKVIIGEGDKGG